MVSLEKALLYYSRISERPKLLAFNNLLLGSNDTGLPEYEINEVDEIFFGIIKAIQSDDRANFEKHYTKKSKSNPSKELSPFVNDDFFIFCLIVGIKRFNLDTKWIKNILSIRNRNEITITFENLLNDNFLNSSNQHEIVIMFLKLNNRALITNELLNLAYKKITSNIELFDSKSDFQILCTLRAYELIIELKVAPDGSEVSLLFGFESKFLKRVKILTWVIQTAFLIIFLFTLMKLLALVPSIKKLFDQYNPIFNIIGILGLSFSGNLIPYIKRKSHEIVLRALGYPKKLIEKNVLAKK